MTEPVRETPLADWHRERGARMVPFAGWSMPVQYPTGTLKEHEACRNGAALFDVSHMLQLHVPGAGAASALERVVPGDIQVLKPGRTRYSVLLNVTGGIVDDLMITKLEDGLFLVVNAGRADVDLPFLQAALPAEHQPQPIVSRALLAVQGPGAVAAVAKHVPECAQMRFLDSRQCTLMGTSARLSRLGYTGEDGFEISLEPQIAAAFATSLVEEGGVVPAGLGARDSLRLEAGLCLYGHELDETTSPIEAGLDWVINKRRWADADFPAAERIVAERDGAVERTLVGLKLEGRAAARQGAEIVAGEDGAVVGLVTSGGFAPSVGDAIALGYVQPEHAALDHRLNLKVRDRLLPAVVVRPPFVPHRYHR